MVLCHRYGPRHICCYLKVAARKGRWNDNVTSEPRTARIPRMRCDSVTANVLLSPEATGVLIPASKPSETNTSVINNTPVPALLDVCCPRYVTCRSISKSGCPCVMRYIKITALICHQLRTSRNSDGKTSKSPTHVNSCVGKGNKGADRTLPAGAPSALIVRIWTCVFLCS